MTTIISSRWLPIAIILITSTTFLNVLVSAQCSAELYQDPRTQSCYKYCPEPFDVTYDAQGGKICTIKRCSGNTTYLNTVTNECLSMCGDLSTTFVRGQSICHPMNCKIYQNLALFDDKDNDYRCITRRCPEGYLLNLEYGYCSELCDAPNVIGELDKVRTCGPPVPSTPIKEQCTTKTPNYNPLTGKCVTNCPSPLISALVSNYTACTCGDGHLYYNSPKVCARATKCYPPTVAITVDGLTLCGKSCEFNNYNRLTGECVSKCPPNIFNYPLNDVRLCDSACPADRPLVIATTGGCVKTCPTGTKRGDKNTCV